MATPSSSSTLSLLVSPAVQVVNHQASSAGVPSHQAHHIIEQHVDDNGGMIREMDVSGGHGLEVTRPTSAHTAAAAPTSASASIDSLSSATATLVQSHQLPSQEVFFDSADRNEGVSEFHHTQHHRLPKQPLTSAATASASAIASTVSSMTPSGLSYGFSGGLEALFQEDPLVDLLNPNFAALPSLAPAAPGSNNKQQPHHLPSSLSSSTSSTLSNLAVDISVGRDFNPLLSPTRHPTNSASPSQQQPAKSALSAMMMAAAAVTDNLTPPSSMTPKNESRGTDSAAIMQASAAASVYASLLESNMSNSPQQSLPLPPPTVSSKQKPYSNPTPGGGPRRGRPPSKKSLPPNLLDSMGHLTPTAAASGFTTPPQPSVKPKVPRGGSARGGKLGYGRGGGAGILANPAALGRAASPATTASPPPTHPGVVSAAALNNNDAIINSIPVTPDIVSSAQSLQPTTSAPLTTGQIGAKPPKKKSNNTSSTPTPANSRGRGGGRGRGRGGRGGRGASSLLGHVTVPAPIELSPLNVSVEPESVSPVVELAPPAEVPAMSASLQQPGTAEPARISSAKPAAASVVVPQQPSVVEPAIPEPPVVLETTATPPADSLPLSASTTASDSTTFSPEPMVDGVNFAAAEPAGLPETDRLNTFLFADEAFYQPKESSVLPPPVGSVISSSDHALAADPAPIPNFASVLLHPGHPEELMDVEESQPSAEHQISNIQANDQPQASTPIATPASTQASSDAGGGPGEASRRLLEADEEDPEGPLTPKNINAKYAKYVESLHKENSVVCNGNVKDHIAQFETPKSLPINAFDVVKHVIEAGGLKNISMTMLLQKLNVPLKTNAYAPRVKRWMNLNHVEGFIESLDPQDLSKLKEPPVTTETPSGSQVNSENSLPSPSSPNTPAIQLAPVVELPAVVPTPTNANNSRKRQRTSSTLKGGEPRRPSISAGSVKKLKSSKSSTAPASASASESFVAADFNNSISATAAAAMMDVTTDVLPNNNVSNNLSTELSLAMTTSPSPATNTVTTTTTTTTSSGTVTATSAAARRRGSLAPVLQNSRWMAALYPSESQLLQEIDVCLLSTSELLAEIPKPPNETQQQQRALEPTKPQTKANQFEVSSRQADLASLKRQLTALNLLVRDHAIEYSVRRSRILPAVAEKEEVEEGNEASNNNAVVVVSEPSLIPSHQNELDYASFPAPNETNISPFGQSSLIPAAAEPAVVDPNPMAVTLYNSNSSEAEQRKVHDQHEQLPRLREQNERLNNSRSYMGQLLRQQRDLVESLRSRVVEPMGEAETTQWRTWAEEVLDVLAFFP